MSASPFYNGTKLPQTSINETLYILRFANYILYGDTDTEGL